MKIDINFNPMPYTLNPYLTDNEVMAINYYKDKGNPQHKTWNYKFREGTKTKDSYITNKYYKSKYDYYKNRFLNNNEVSTGFIDFSESDEREIQKMSYYLSSAINKSKIPSKFTVFRGIKDNEIIEECFKNKLVFRFSGFGSFSTSFDVAREHAGEFNKSPTKYFLSYNFNPKNDYALYIDKEEEEWLLPKNLDFVIVEKDYWENNPHEIVYYITKENK